MKIIEKVQKKITEVEANSEMEVQINDKAVAAILKGVGSQEWEEYMRIFTEDALELNRLKLVETRLSFYAERSVAYLVAYGVCTSTTITRTKTVLHADLDE